MKINNETASIYDAALFIVELHHQYIGSVWMADDKSDFVDTCQTRYQHDGEAPNSDDYDDWVDYNGHDLRSQVILNIEDAVNYVEAGKEGSSKLAKLFESYGFIEEDA